ncbi:MAG: primosomal protein [Candidatus Endolissoclinum sp. TMED37]|nr:MAG: primosomal protein [Candidatus Endolissoclinum sp. TMED37]
MKLIKEINEEIQYIAEEKDGKKNLFIEGVFLQSNLKNRNGRMYPKEVMAKEVARYTAENIEKNRALGELGHPDGPTLNLDRVSHMIVSLKEDGDNYVGKAKILDTPMGKIAANLIEAGAQLGVSSRGLGSIKERNGINEVQDDFVLATAADIVADPSAPDAYVEGVMESREWVMVDGVWHVREMEQAQQYIRQASRHELDEAKLNVFNNFMKKLSKI